MTGADRKPLPRAALMDLGKRCADRHAAGVDDLPLGDPLRAEIEALKHTELSRIEYFAAGAAYARRKAAEAAAAEAIAATVVPSTPQLLADYQIREAREAHVRRMRGRAQGLMIAVLSSGAIWILLGDIIRYWMTGRR